eukprot:20219-Amorphochlora_amoeboformis.AAC.1
MRLISPSCQTSDRVRSVLVLIDCHIEARARAAVPIERRFCGSSLREGAGTSAPSGCERSFRVRGSRL